MSVPGPLPLIRPINHRNRLIPRSQEEQPAAYSANTNSFGCRTGIGPVCVGNDSSIRCKKTGRSHFDWKKRRDRLPWKA